MKRLITCLICLVTINIYAQDTLKKTNSVGKFDEQYMVLKSDKKVRQGSYKLYTDKKLIASGAYDKGKRTGVWNFYNNDVLEQQYDYTNNKLLLNINDPAITCELENASPGDAVTPAIKTGGYNGFKFMVANTGFESNISEGGRNMITHVLTIDETGQIKSWVATVKSSDGLKVVNQSAAEAPAELAQFIPATLNGKATASTVTFHGELNGKSAQTDANDQGNPTLRGGGGGRRGGRP